MPTYIGRANWGEAQAQREQALVEQAPMLAALTTARDGIGFWLSAGQALAAMLLRAAEDGVQAAYLNPVVQVPELRQRLREHLGVSGQPQILLRLGYVSGTSRPAPRRPVDAIMADPEKV